MFEIRESSLVGCVELRPPVFADHRGRFVKVFHAESFSRLGLESAYSEDFLTTSHRGVIRGLHFQTPPFDHAKLVYCAHGGILDAVVDLRVGSPSFGRFAVFEVTAEKANCIYMPKGFAHGFCVTGDVAVVGYKVSVSHAPDNDSGILWDSVGIPWPTSNPILSERDMAFPRFADFSSPFSFGTKS